MQRKQMVAANPASRNGRDMHGEEEEDKEQCCRAMSGMQETLLGKTRQATVVLPTNLAKSGCQEATGGPVPQP